MLFGRKHLNSRSEGGRTLLDTRKASRRYCAFKPLIFNGKENGAQGRNRTTDTAIFSRMLYQLSYLGIRCAAGPCASWRGV